MERIENPTGMFLKGETNTRIGKANYYILANKELMNGTITIHLFLDERYTGHINTMLYHRRNEIGNRTVFAKVEESRIKVVVMHRYRFKDINEIENIKEEDNEWIAAYITGGANKSAA